MEFRHEVVIPNEDLPFRMFLFEGKNGNYKVTRHWHQSVEIFLVLQGSIGFYMNSDHIPLTERKFVIVNSNELHSIDSPEPNRTVVLQIPAEHFREFCGQDSYMNFGQGTPEAGDHLISLIEAMFQTYEKKEYGYQLQVRGQFYGLLYLLVSLFQEEAAPAVIRQKRQRDRLSRITAYMKENYREDLRLEEVAKKFGFTPTYLSRIFQKYAEVNYRTYLIDLRVKYAVRELRGSDHEIGDIAMAHGFPDSRAFSKAFKKRYGCLPSEYRKLLQE